MINQRLLIKTAFWIMIATLGSRVLGFLREVQLAYYFGLSSERAAFTVAFKIPNLIRTLIADAAISAAFVPVFTELLMKKNKEDAWKVSSQMINLTFLLLTFVVLLCEWCMPTIIAITTPGFTKDAALLEHTIALSRIIFPIITILGVGGVLVGILHSMNIFGAPAIAPIFWNVVNIAFVFFLAQTMGIYAAAWGLLGATVLQLFIQASPLFNIPWKYSLHFDFSHPALRQVGILIVPVTISIGIVNFNALIDNFFASLLGPAQVAAIDSAFRLFQLPQGLFAIAIGTVLFPTLSTLAAQKDAPRFARGLQTGIRQIFYITLPFTAWFITLSLPITQLCFERGLFTAKDSQMVHIALLFYAFGLAFTSANTLLNRGFYSLKKTWLPLYVGGINMGLNALLDWWLMKYFGHGGICFSTSLVSTFNFFALCYLMKREVPEFALKPIVISLLKQIGLISILGFASWIFWQRLTITWPDASLLSQFFKLATAIVGSGLIYMALSYVFQLEEFKQNLILFKKSPIKKSS